MADPKVRTRISGHLTHDIRCEVGILHQTCRSSSELIKAKLRARNADNDVAIGDARAANKSVF